MSSLCNLPLLVFHFKGVLVVLQVQNSSIGGLGRLQEAVVVLDQKLNVQISHAANFGLDVEPFAGISVLIPAVVQNQV